MSTPPEFVIGDAVQIIFVPAIKPLCAVVHFILGCTYAAEVILITACKAIDIFFKIILSLDNPIYLK